jgi:hypothetical protein
MSNQSPTAATVFDSMDNKTRRAIVSLNNKLLTLQIEIEKKLSDFAPGESEQLLNKQKQLLMLADEVKRALQSMDHVVQLALFAENPEGDVFDQYQEELDIFREMILLSAKQMDKMGTKK